MGKQSGPPKVSPVWEGAYAPSQDTTLYLPQVYGYSFDIKPRLVKAINAARVEAGLLALPIDASLSMSAQSHADDMRNRSYFSHDTVDGPTWVDRIRFYHPNGAIGECIAAAYKSPEIAVVKWLESPGHRDIILQIGDMPAWDHMGVGYTFGGQYTRYYVLDVGTT